MTTATRERPLPPASTRRAIRAVGAVLLVWGALCASHEGEFWPFSIYPMFSRAGQSWTRVLVRDVSGVRHGVVWSPYRLDDLPGEPLPLAAFGVHQNDLAGFVSRTNRWAAPERDDLRAMFADDRLSSRALLVMKVLGSLDSRDTVRIEALPWVLIDDSVTVRPGQGDRGS